MTDLVRHVSRSVLPLLVHRPERPIILVAPDVSWSSRALAMFASEFDLVGGHLEVPAAELATRGARAQHVTLVRFEHFAILGQVGVDTTPALFIQQASEVIFRGVWF